MLETVEIKASSKVVELLEALRCDAGLNGLRVILEVHPRHYAEAEGKLAAEIIAGHLVGALGMEAPLKNDSHPNGAAWVKAEKGGPLDRLWLTVTVFHE